MRENRPYGSEGGAADAPTPIRLGLRQAPGEQAFARTSSYEGRLDALPSPILRRLSSRCLAG